MKYRIIRVKEFEDIYYIVQQKILFFWISILDGLSNLPAKYSTLADAEKEIGRLKSKPKKTVIKVYD